MWNLDGCDTVSATVSLDELHNTEHTKCSTWHKRANNDWSYWVMRHGCGYIFHMLLSSGAHIGAATHRRWGLFPMEGMSHSLAIDGAHFSQSLSAFHAFYRSLSLSISYFLVRLKQCNTFMGSLGSKPRVGVSLNFFPPKTLNIDISVSILFIEIICHVLTILATEHVQSILIKSTKTKMNTLKVICDFIFDDPVPNK